ncbi:hypothetical protein EVAR_48906_1 [Eumeta japonica]|uniref:Uncharacterized protein n=1 Tax=Eumeta variegata TaxID=151549 RepID=A0A4C1YWU3_EUMVA|nr:hypothetical protein EVAR_48906_1 [Eumeta japonica]
MAFHTHDIPMRGVRADGCPALKWLSWTMADRPVVLVNGPRKVSQTQLWGNKDRREEKLLQKATTTPPVLGTPPANIERAKSSQSKKTRTVASDDVSAVPAPKVVVEVGPADAAAAARVRGRRLYRAGGGGRLRQTGEPKTKLAVRPVRVGDEITSGPVRGPPRPELRKAESARPDALPQEDWRLNRKPAMEARRELEGLKI